MRNEGLSKGCASGAGVQLPDHSYRLFHGAERNGTVRNWDAAYRFRVVDQFGIGHFPLGEAFLGGVGAGSGRGSN